jgi:hypothetical protein
MHCEKYELRIRYQFPDSSGGVQSVQKRHREIRNNYIWPESDGFSQQGPTVPYRSNDGKCFFQQVDTQSISEDRVVIGDEDARAERISVDSLHWDNPLDPPELRFGRRRKASEGKNPLGTPSLANRRRKLVKWPVSVS